MCRRGTAPGVSRADTLRWLQHCSQFPQGAGHHSERGPVLGPVLGRTRQPPAAQSPPVWGLLVLTPERWQDVVSGHRGAFFWDRSPWVPRSSESHPQEMRRLEASQEQPQTQPEAAMPGCQAQCQTQRGHQAGPGGELEAVAPQVPGPRAEERGPLGSNVTQGVARRRGAGDVLAGDAEAGARRGGDDHGVVTGVLAGPREVQAGDFCSGRRWEDWSAQEGAPGRHRKGRWERTVARALMMAGAAGRGHGGPAVTRVGRSQGEVETGRPLCPGGVAGECGGEALQRTGS